MSKLLLENAGIHHWRLTSPSTAGGQRIGDHVEGLCLSSLRSCRVDADDPEDGQDHTRVKKIATMRLPSPLREVGEQRSNEHIDAESE